jgi:hypothetical protein
MAVQLSLQIAEVREVHKRNSDDWLEGQSLDEHRMQRNEALSP